MLAPSITYVGISKIKSTLHNRSSYLLSYDKSQTLVRGEVLVYGWLQSSKSLGKNKGWFKRPLSMDINDFYRSYDIVSGSAQL